MVKLEPSAPVNISADRHSNSAAPASAIRIAAQDQRRPAIASAAGRGRARPAMRCGARAAWHPSWPPCPAISRPMPLDRRRLASSGADNAALDTSPRCGRRASSNSSRSSLMTSRAPQPLARSARNCRGQSAVAPMSRPRVGCAAITTRGSNARARAPAAPSADCRRTACRPRASARGSGCRSRGSAASAKLADRARPSRPLRLNGGVADARQHHVSASGSAVDQPRRSCGPRECARRRAPSSRAA